MSDWNGPGDPHRQQGYPQGQGWSGGPPYSPGPGGPGPSWSQPGQPQWSAGPPQPQQEPAPGAKNSARPLLLGMAVGVAVAVLIGAVLVVTKVVHFGSSTSAAAVDTRPIALPDALGGLTNYAAAVQAKAGSGKSTGALTTNQHMVSLTESAYQKAYGGAATSVRSYASSDLLGIYTVIAVRASAPGLVTGPVNDPADLGLARNQQAIEAIGDQQCNVASIEVVQAGKAVDNSKLLTAACQRTGTGLTVWAFGGGVDGPAGQAQITGLVDAAYNSISGGK